MRRAHDAYVIKGNVDEQLIELHILLRKGVQQVMKLQTRDREYGLAVELGVVETIQQMYAAGTGSDHAYAEFSGKFRIRARSKRCRFLVPYLNETDFVLTFPKRFDHTIDAIAGNTKDDADAPVDQHVDQNVTCG